MNIHNLVLSIGVASSGVLFLPQEANASLYWTPYVSEEGSPVAICQGTDEGAVGFGCTGRFCDNNRLLCETLPFGARIESYEWSEPFSEEREVPITNNIHYCTRSLEGGYVQAGVVTGIRCSGSYCDNIAVECGYPTYEDGVCLDGPFQPGPNDMTCREDCGWSGWYSEEQGSVDFGYQRYIMGVECSGHYCDNKRFLVCSLSP